MSAAYIDWSSVPEDVWSEGTDAIARRYGVARATVYSARRRQGHPLTKARKVRISMGIRKDAADRIDALQKRWATTKVATVERCIDEAYDREMKKEDS